MPDAPVPRPYSRVLGPSVHQIAGWWTVCVAGAFVASGPTREVALGNALTAVQACYVDLLDLYGEED